MFEVSGEKVLVRIAANILSISQFNKIFSVPLSEFFKTAMGVVCLIMKSLAI